MTIIFYYYNYATILSKNFSEMARWKSRFRQTVLIPMCWLGKAILQRSMIPYHNILKCYRPMEIRTMTKLPKSHEYSFSISRGMRCSNFQMTDTILTYCHSRYILYSKIFKCSRAKCLRWKMIWKMSKCHQEAHIQLYHTESPRVVHSYQIIFWHRYYFR